MIANVIITTFLLLMFFFVYEIAITSRFEEAFQRGVIHLIYPVWGTIVFTIMVIVNARIIYEKKPSS